MGFLLHHYWQLALIVGASLVIVAVVFGPVRFDYTAYKADDYIFLAGAGFLAGLLWPVTLVLYAYMVVRLVQLRRAPQ
jgi:hypothetical protein